jgi:hypothetical protein
LAQAYRANFLRIPKRYLKDNRSVIEKQLHEEQDPDMAVSLRIRAHAQSTNPEVKAKLEKY